MTEPRPSKPDGSSALESDEDSELRARVSELELRLRERVHEVVVLYEETRILQEERSVRDEFIRSMEADVLRLPAAEQQLIDTDNAYKHLHAQFEAYRNNADHQIAEMERQVDSAQVRLAELDAIITAFEHRRAIVLSKRLRNLVRQVPGAASAARAARGGGPADRQY